MATKLNDGELSSYAIDNDTAVITVKGQKFVVDYSTLMDFVTELAVVASQVEHAAVNAKVSDEDQLEQVCTCARLH